MNTRRNRGAGLRDTAVEYLREPADLAAWLGAAGLDPAGLAVAGLGGPGPGGPRPGASADPVGGVAVDDQTFAGALGLREALDAAITATVGAGSVPGEAVICVNEWIAAEPQRPVLRLEGGVPVRCAPQGARTPRGALALIAADAADVLGTGLRERLRICPGPGCHGRFLDDSPAGRRRWCSMAVCGNRNKAAAHRQAAHAAARTN